MILYIDPGTGTLIINFLVAIVSSIIYYLRKFLFRKLYKNSTKNSEITIFSEGNQYKNTFFPIINELIKRKVYFNYFTLDYKDQILDVESEFINSKYLGYGILSKLNFNSISSKVLLSTTPNIGNKDFPFNKPRKISELIHVWHSISDISYYKKGSLDSYNTILTVGDFQNKSIREIESLRNLKPKKLIPVGLPYFDVFREKLVNIKNINDNILIASSWGDKGFLKNHGYKIINLLKDYNIIVRPHPQSFISEKEFIRKFKIFCSTKSNVKWDECLDPLESFSKSKIIISDTSSIRYDFSFLTGKPVITIKINKSNFKDFESSYFEKSWDEKNENIIGVVLDENNLKDLVLKITKIDNGNIFSKNINKLKKETIYNVNKSSKNIVDYLKSIKE